MVRAGGMSSLINAGDGIDIDIQLRRENRSKTIDKVAQRIRLNRTKLKSMQDTSTDYEELTNSIQAGYFIKYGIANNNEDLFYMSVFVTVSAKGYEELMWRKQQIVDMLKSMDMYVSDCRFQQEAALRSVMPFLKIESSLEKKSRRNVLTSGAASAYVFTSFEMSDDTGVLLGINRHNNSLCISAYYIVLSDQDATMAFLSSLFFSFMFIKLTRYADSRTIAQVIPQYRHTEGQGRRRLLTPDEVLRLPNEEMLCVIRGCNLLKLTKLDFTKHPMSKQIVRTSIMDYQPATIFTAPILSEPVPVTEPEKKPARKKSLYSSAKPPEGF